MDFIAFIRQLYVGMLPRVCILCGTTSQHSQNICTPCLTDLPILPKCCERCARFLATTLTDKLICGTCLKTPTPFERTLALFPYEPPIIQLITRLKFSGQLSFAKTMGLLLREKMTTCWYASERLPDIIIPVPLHDKRLQERGFNQALEIAKQAVRGLSVTLDVHGVKREKCTAPQSGLLAIERQRNVRDAFMHASENQYAGKKIAIFDDVITSGATVSTLAQMLKKRGGAKTIHVWCIARRG